MSAAIIWTYLAVAFGVLCYWMEGPTRRAWVLYRTAAIPALIWGALLLAAVEALTA